MEILDATEAAKLINTTLQELRKKHVALHWVVTGGRTIKKIYDILCETNPPESFQNDFFYFSDERVVPEKEKKELSNFQNVYHQWFLPAHIPLNHVFPITDVPSYEAQIKKIQRRPKFDITLLSMGDDGHIASLFPNAPLPVPTAFVLDVPAPKHITPHVARISLSYHAILQSEVIFLLIQGAQKRDLFLRGNDLPAHKIAEHSNCHVLYLE